MDINTHVSSELSGQVSGPRPASPGPFCRHPSSAENCKHCTHSTGHRRHLSGVTG